MIRISPGFVPGSTVNPSIRSGLGAAAVESVLVVVDVEVEVAITEVAALTIEVMLSLAFVTSIMFAVLLESSVAWASCVDGCTDFEEPLNLVALPLQPWMPAKTEQTATKDTILANFFMTYFLSEKRVL